MMRSVLLLSLLIAVAFAGKSKAATTTAADAEAFIRGAASSFLGAEIPAAAKCSTSFSEADLTTLTTALNDFKTFDPMAWSNAFSKISPIMNDVKACASSAGTDATEAKAFEAKLMKSFGANSFLTDAWDVLTKDHSTLWSEAFGSGGMIPSFEAKNFGAAGTKFGDIVVTIVNTNTALVQTTDDHWSEVEPLSEADTSTSTSAPCHYLNNNYCKETSDSSSCKMTWEKTGTCKAVSFPVCCKGHYDIQLWFKSGTVCSKEGRDPMSPC